MQTADLQTCRPADLQTQHSGLSQFILKIILCNVHHSASSAVRLVGFNDTWLLSRLSFRNKIRTCASFEKTLSNYFAVDNIIKGKFLTKMQFERFFYILKYQDRVNSPTNEACWIEFMAVGERRNMEHSGTSRNIPEHEKKIIKN